MTIAAKAFAEMMGTFAVVFVGGTSILLVEKFPNVFPSFVVAVTFGLMVTLMILAAGHVSGAHFNPAVTLAFAVTRRLPLSQIPFYWASQLIGGWMAAILLTILGKL